MKLTVEKFTASNIKECIKNFNESERSDVLRFAARTAVCAGADYLIINEEASKEDREIDPMGRVDDCTLIANYVVCAVRNVEIGDGEVKQKIIDYSNSK